MTNQDKQSPHWIDKLVDRILEWKKDKEVKQLHVDDMKTPSGRVHTGALRGVILHDLVHQVLLLRGLDETKGTYVFNDMDPMDGLPSYLPKEDYFKHMGKPLHQIPAPSLEESGIDFSHASAEEIEEFKNADSFAEFYALDFIKAFRNLGCRQDIIWSHELYQSGQMDEHIRTVLDNVDQIKQVYKDVADYELPENWYPFQVICPECGRVGTTETIDWDGEQVTFECKVDKVEWAQGCGYKGKISPFGGTGKLLWKVDWPAHWQAMGVNVEGAGKDHTSAGGSRDMANALLEKVFESLIPFDIPYEWILIRGAKMSSSKGVGTSAREFTKILPPEIGRFLFVNKHYNQVIDFDPTTDAIPDLFDEYDQGARIYWGQEEGDQRLGRSFELSQVDDMPEAHYLPRFRDMAVWMQHPEINLIEKFEEEKGSALTDQEITVLEDRKDYAQIWVKRHAPEAYQLTPTTTVPKQAEQLTEEQKEYLAQVDELMDSQSEWEPEKLQQELYELSKESLGARQAFQSIYLAFIGKKHGPRAAWMLLDMDQSLRRSRIDQVTK
jgi:lysyl-tRNA synthetase class 1